MLRKLLCLLGKHKWTWQHRNDALDAMGYFMLGSMNRFEKARAYKRLMAALEKGAESKIECKHCGRRL